MEAVFAACLIPLDETSRRQNIQDAVAEWKPAAKALTKPAFAVDPDEPKSSHTGYQA